MKVLQAAPAAYPNRSAVGGTSIGGAIYLVEWDAVESRLPDAAGVSEILSRAATAEAAELWVHRDCGPRRRSWLGRLFGTPARDIEPCFWLAKAGGVAALTFHDLAWSEYRATDPDGPAQATEAQRMALSCGEPTPAPRSSACEPSERSRPPLSTSPRASGPDGWCIGTCGSAQTPNQALPAGE
jgi:hypothetical protein